LTVCDFKGLDVLSSCVAQSAGDGDRLAGSR